MSDQRYDVPDTVAVATSAAAVVARSLRVGYVPGRANDPHYPADLQAALTRIRVNDTVAADTATSAYGSDAAAVTQSGSRPATRVAELDQLSIEIEDRLGEPQRVADELRLRLGLRIDVTAVPLGTLPRYETKGHRFVDHR